MERRSWTERRRKSHVLAVFAMLCATSSHRFARAEGPEAEALASQGIELRRVHKNVEALEVFRRALSLSSTPRIRAHVGLAEQSVGEWVEAERDIGACLLQ